MSHKRLVLLLVSFFAIQTFGAPTDPSEQSLVVSSTEKSIENASDHKDAPTETVSGKPKIYQMHLKSVIGNRFARTTIVSKVKNLDANPREATFAVVLPETAFISSFVMEIDGKNYTAHVKEKEAAKRTYEEAVASGLGAAHVAVSARDSNSFTISVNVEPKSKATFYLGYEQLLTRQDGRYEQVINLHPGQPVQDLSVEVVITENRKITDLKAPPIRSGNEIRNDNAELDPRADIEVVNETSAVIRFSPNVERQKQLAHVLGTKEEDGLAGQFVVQYDVERDPTGGEVLIQDGYFVHFFAPTDLTPLPKHVVFVLDTSGSMEGQKIQQLKEAMNKILEQLHENDVFNLVEFNSIVRVWDISNFEKSVTYPLGSENVPSHCIWTFHQLAGRVNFKDAKFPAAYSANADNIKKAKEAVSKLHADSLTDIDTALRVGLHLVELRKVQNSDTVNHQPIIMFLTDGEPTIGVQSTEEIINEVTDWNSGIRKSAVFTLSFGDGADKKFLEKLALPNSGFSKHIYEAADASLQLQDFYKQISSPLLADVTFKYEPAVTSLTRSEFPIHFNGSELVVAGFCGTDKLNSLAVKGRAVHDVTFIEPGIYRSTSNIERLWAYLTIKQLLDKERILSGGEEKDVLKKKAIDLSLKYSFVTPVSSLVVVKPNGTSSVDSEAALNPSSAKSSSNAFIALSAPAPGLATLPPPSLQYTTPFCPEVWFSTTTETPDLFNTLPWLKDVVNEHGTLDAASGKYKLGLNETISDVVACPKTPLGGAGHCKLLHSCRSVHATLTTSKMFIEHLCVIRNEFAGICCPDDS